MSAQNLRILIVSDTASSQFGGEAILPWHIFRILRKRGIEAWLLVHERTRVQLEQDFPEDVDRIYFVADRLIHRQLNALGAVLPEFVGTWTAGYVSHFITQLAQRKKLKTLISELDINVIHQPTPVSPREPSLLFGFGIPVVIGPMNGGMEYPPAFRKQSGKLLVHTSMQIGRWLARGFNRLIPGKRQAAVLLVANARSHDALPVQNHPNVQYLVENGVDLSLWDNGIVSLPELDQGATVIPMSEPSPKQADVPKTRFVFVGRLVEWKAVDILLLAFKQAMKRYPATLEIIGSGEKYDELNDLAKKLGFSVSQGQVDTSTESVVYFSGWLSQPDCARRLQSSDVLVLPSLYECGGAVVLEAMAMGLPVVATKWGGPTDYLNESCGILVNPDSREQFIQDFAEAMCELAKDPARRAAMGSAGRDRVQAYFDWDAKVNRMIEIYQHVISASKNTDKRTPQVSSQMSSLFSRF